MKLPPIRFLTLTAVLLAGVVAGRAEAVAPASPSDRAAAKKTSPAPAEKRAEANAADAKPAPATGGVADMAREFGEKSKGLIDSRKALLERLRLARTDEEKQRILAELRQQQQARLEQQRELARQIREQMQNNRKEVRPAGPGG